MKALLSVFDKTGIVEFAQNLDRLGVEILSTGGTAGALAGGGVPVTEISDYTGFPEMMDGRLKTLHPKIAGGILGRSDDRHIMRQHNIEPIHWVVVNFYPFEKVVANPDCDFKTAIENIDIGGPTMVRAAAKNWTRVAVVVDPADYEWVGDSFVKHGGLSDKSRYDLMVKAFDYTARYDAAIAKHLHSRGEYQIPS